MNLKKKSLSAKFYFVVFLFTVALGINIYLGFSGMGEVRDSLKHIVETVAVRQGKWVEIRDLQRQMVIQERDLMLLKDPAAREEVGKKIDLLAEKVSEVVESYKAIATPEGMAQAEQYGGDFGLWYAEHMMIRMLVSEGQMAEAEQISNGKAQELRDKMGASIDHMTETNRHEMEAAVSESESDYTRVRSLMTLVGAISLFGGVALAWFILRAINGSIDQVIGYLEKNSEQVGLASHQIANASQSLSQASTSQASSLQQTAASIEQLTSMVQRNLESAQRASELSAGSQSNAMKGKTVVDEMSKAISEIDQSNNDIMTQVEDSNRRIGEITKVISEIGEKTKVINDIVFQTRLLSFNASVEAARAGEHGKGFAVVAEEVGNLANMSGNAAKEISSMLDESIQKVESIVNDTRGRVDGLIQSGKSKVEVGVRIANECGTVLDEIVQSVTEVSQVSAGIASASQEQAQGVREISKAMHMLDQVTQTNAAASEQAAGAAEQLSHQADSLKSAVRQLIAAVKGDSKAKSASVEEAPIAQEAAKSVEKSPDRAAVKSKAGPQAKAKSATKPKAASTEKAPAPAPAAKAESRKVVNFDLGKKKKKQEASAAPAKAAKAETKTSVASESDIPAENDPRFRDI